LVIALVYLLDAGDRRLRSAGVLVGVVVAGPLAGWLGTRHALLEHVNLAVHAGELVCLLGPNGIGKSTLLKVLAGLEQADEGQVIRTGAVGYLPQEPAPIAGETVLVTFAIPVPPKTKPADFYAFLQQQGFLRVLLYGEVVRTDEPPTRGALPGVRRFLNDRRGGDLERRAGAERARLRADRRGQGRHRQEVVGIHLPMERGRVATPFSLLPCGHHEPDHLR